MTFPFRRNKKSVETSPSKMKLKPGEHVKLVTPKKSKKPKKAVTWAKKLENVKNYNNQKNTQKENYKITKNLVRAKFRAIKETERAQKRKELNF